MTETMTVTDFKSGIKAAMLDRFAQLGVSPKGIEYAGRRIDQLSDVDGSTETLNDLMNLVMFEANRYESSGFDTIAAERQVREAAEIALREAVDNLAEQEGWSEDFKNRVMADRYETFEAEELDLYVERLYDKHLGEVA